MKIKILAILSLAVLSLTANAQPLGTAFNYTGQLLLLGVPVTGLYDFQFTLFTTAGPVGGPTAGTPNPNDRVAVPVTNGLFTVTLDFGGGAGVFSGDARWLGITVRTNDPTDSYTALTPRQQLTPTPYALYALDADKAASATIATTARSVRWEDILNRPPGLDDGHPDTTYSAGVGLALSADNRFSLGMVPLDRISTDGASEGHSLMFNAGTIQWAAPPASLSLTLPYSGSVESGGASFFVSNDDVGPLAAGSAISGSHASSGAGIKGVSVSGNGVRGSHSGTTGKSAGVMGGTFSEEDGASGVSGTVFAPSPGNFSAGVLGVNQSEGSKGAGVRGTHAGSGFGVVGTSQTGSGVVGTGARGIDGYSINGVGVAGATFDGTGVYGDNGNSDTVGHAGYFNGRVTITGTASVGALALARPVTRYQSYHALTFTEYVDSYDHYHYAAVHLPHGATIIGLKAIVNDEDPGHDIDVTLRSVHHRTMARVQSSGSSGIQTLTADVTPTVFDNEDDAYFLYVYYFLDIFDPLSWFQYVVITYTVTQPLP